jgi:hypothetical protein
MELSAKQLDKQNENLLYHVCFTIGAKMRMEDNSSKRVDELKEVLDSSLELLMRQNWVNTEKLN